MQFSVIVPCYNSEAYLPKLFKCLTEQTFNANDFEIICINDASSDNTAKVLQAYQELLPSQLKVYHHQVNKGVSAARNLGMSVAQGEWLLFLDCDDWFNSIYLQTLANAVANYPNHKLFLTAIANHYQETGKEKLLKDSAPRAYSSKDALGNLVFDLGVANDFFRAVSRNLLSRDIINKHQLQFRSDIHYGEDALFHFQYLNALKQEVLASSKEADRLNTTLATQVSSQVKPSSQVNSDSPAKGRTEKEASPNSTTETSPQHLETQVQPATQLLYQAVYVPNAIYFYFKVPQVRQRSHDKYNSNLVVGEYLTNQAHLELARQNNFEESHLHYMFKSVAFSVVFALFASKNLNDLTPQRRADLQQYLRNLQEWLLVFRDLGQTTKFLTCIKNADFLLRSRAIPHALFLQTVASNPALLDQAIAHLELLPADYQPASDIPPQTSSSEGSNPAPQLQTSLWSQLLNFLKKLFGTTTKQQDDNNRATLLDNVPTSEKTELYLYGNKVKLDATDVSSLNNQPVNSVNKVAFLYYDKVHYGNKTYLSIVTNNVTQLEQVFVDINLNHKNLTRCIPYRFLGIELGKQYLIDTSLLTKNEMRALEVYCDDLRQSNFFDYQEKAPVAFTYKLIKGFSNNDRNFIVTANNQANKEALVTIAKHLGDVTEATDAKLVNAFELPYPLALDVYDVAMVRQAKKKAHHQQLMARLTATELETTAESTTTPLDSPQVVASHVTSEAHATTTLIQQQEVVATEPHHVAAGVDQENVATTTDNTSKVSDQEKHTSYAEDDRQAEDATMDGVTLGVDVVDQATQPQDLLTKTIALKDIFAQYRIRGFRPTDYTHHYRSINLEELLEANGLSKSFNYYGDYARANSILLPLSLISDSTWAGEQLFSRRFPIFDCLVVVDCQVSDYILESLTRFPNLRLVFPSASSYKAMLDALLEKSATSQQITQKQVNSYLYQHYFDQWQLLRRSFVLVAKQ